MKIAIIDDNNQEQLRLKQHIFDWSQQCGIAVSVEIFDSGISLYTLNRFESNTAVITVRKNGYSVLHSANPCSVYPPLYLVLYTQIMYKISSKYQTM